MDIIKFLILSSCVAIYLTHGCNKIFQEHGQEFSIQICSASTKGFILKFNYNKKEGLSGESILLQVIHSILKPIIVYAGLAVKRAKKIRHYLIYIKKELCRVLLMRRYAILYPILKYDILRKDPKSF